MRSQSTEVMKFLLLLASVGWLEGFGIRNVFRSHHASHQRIDIGGNVKNAKTCRDASFMPLSMSESSDDADSFGEDLTYLNEEFSRIAGGRTLISFEDFLGSEAIQAILSDEDSDEYLGDIREIWISKATSVEKSIDCALFIAINREVDDLFEYIDDVEDDEGQELSDIIDKRNSNTEEELEDGEIIEVRDVGMWDSEFDVKDYFGLDFLKYLKKFYDENADEKNGLLSYSRFCQWQDIRQMLIDGELDETCLSELWAEAIQEKNNKQPSADNDENKNPKKGFKEDSSDVKNGFINFEIFARMNVRLDVVLDEIKEALGNLSDDDVEKFYKEEFAKLSGGEDLISFDQLLEWSEVQQLIKEGDLSTSKFNEMWEALPKRPLDATIKKEIKNENSNKKESSKKSKQLDGIGSDAFSFFVTALDDLDSETSTGALE